MRPPSKKVLAVYLLPLLAIPIVRSIDLGGPGTNNVVTYLLLLLAHGWAGFWFLCWSGLSGGFKATSVALFAGSLWIASVFVHFEGWTGDMVPVLRVGKAPEAEWRTVAVGAEEQALEGAVAQDSPEFGGPGRRFQAPVRLARDWKASPPVELWRQDVGEGWSGFAIVGEVAFTQEQRDDEQAVTAYDAETGELLWIYAWRGRYDDGLGGPGPRATPTFADDRIFAQGPAGKLVALSASTGELLWEQDLRARYGMTDELEQEYVDFGRAGSPLVHEGKVIVPAGGDPDGKQAGLVAFDVATGELEWEAPAAQISYGSPSLVSLHGALQVLIVNEDTVSGHDPSTGQRLWEHPWPGRTSGKANCSQARVLGDDRVFLSKGYGQGAALLKLGADHSVVQLWHDTRGLRTKFSNAWMREGEALGLSDGILTCISLETGKRKWRQGRYGFGQILGTEDLLLVLAEDGRLALVDPEGGEELGLVQALEGKTWNQPAMAGDRLFVRNGREAAAYRLTLRD